MPAHRPARARLASNPAARLLERLLTGARSPDTVAESALIDLCCFGVLDQVLALESEAVQCELRARYDVIFANTVIGLYEDRMDGTRGTLPRGFYEGAQGVANSVILVRHVIESVLGLAPEEVPRTISLKVLRQHQLGQPLKRAFGLSPFAAVDAAYPGRYKPWEFAHAPQGIWQGERGRERAVEATRWMYETRLGWPIEEIAARTSQDLFAQHGLQGMLICVYRSSPFLAVEAAYPGRFCPWQMQRAPTSYWTGPKGRVHAVAAIRWLIEEKLGWDDADIRGSLTLETFVEHDLGGLLSKRYNGSVLAAMEEAYPGRFRPVDIWKQREIVWAGPERRDRAIAAVRELIEDVLKWPPAMVKVCMTSEVFYAFGLRGALARAFDSSVLQALEAAYPGRYRAEDLAGYRYTGGSNDRLLVAAQARLRLLVEATFDEDAAMRRHGASRPQLEALRNDFARRGLAALIARPQTSVVSIDDQLAVRELTRRQPLLDADEVSSRLRQRGIAISASQVRRVWRMHGLVPLRSRYRLAATASDCATTAAAARKLGTSFARVRYNRRIVERDGFAGLCARYEVEPEKEQVILKIIRSDPSLGRSAILAELRRGRLAVSEHDVTMVLARFGITTAEKRAAACGTLPRALRPLVPYEREIQRQVSRRRRVAESGRL